MSIINKKIKKNKCDENEFNDFKLIYFFRVRKEKDIQNSFDIIMYFLSNFLDDSYSKLSKYNNIFNDGIFNYLKSIKNNDIIIKEIKKYMFWFKNYKKISILKYITKYLENLKKFNDIKIDKKINLENIDVNNTKKVRELKKLIKNDLNKQLEKEYWEKIYHLLSLILIEKKIEKKIILIKNIDLKNDKILKEFVKIINGIFEDDLINEEKYSYYEEKESNDKIFNIDKNNVIENFDEYLNKKRLDITNDYIDNFFKDSKIDNKNIDFKMIKDLIFSEENEKNNNFYQFNDKYLTILETDNKDLWIDQFKPRKPHFFNRVILGYEWTKENQKFYSLENPPPRDILGYKFNIFYPNLINKNQKPIYKLESCNNIDFCIIKFCAGPPYEDLAFKIKNKKWNQGDRKSFKCNFDKGIFYLYFEFEKIIYRK